MEEVKNTAETEMEIGTDTEAEQSKKEIKKEKIKKEKKPMDKAKKKKVIRRSIIFGVIGVVVLYFVLSSLLSGPAASMAYTVAVTKGDIAETIDTSGSVESQNEKTYFAAVGAVMGKVDVKAGDAVEAGQVMLEYDQTSLDTQKQLAELSLQATEGSYSNSVQNNNEKLGDLGEASTNLEVLDQQIADTETYIKNLEAKIEKKKSDLAHEGTLLQISLLDWQNQPQSEEYLNLQKLVQLNSYEQTNNKEVQSWNDELSAYNDMLSKYKEYKSEMKSQKSSAEAGDLTTGAKEELEANTETKKIQSSQTLEDISEVESGITADFDGVVTAVNIIEGATPAAGTQLCTLKSTEDVAVQISVTKYDLEKIAIGQKATVTINSKPYEGEVEKVNKMAEKNASGAPVVGAFIKITNPDSDIVLGVEAKVSITTAQKEGVLLIPVGGVNTDTNGDFAYVVQDGIVVRKEVTTGISSDTHVEVIEGLSEGDQVITDISANIVEGAAVVAIPQE